MTTLEKKIDLALRWIASGDLNDQDNLREEIIDILKEEDTIVSVPKYKSLDDVVNNFLLELGIPANLKGFQYIAYIIKMVVNDQDKRKKSITKELYPAISKQFHATLTSVERAIRHAIEVACDNGLLMHHDNLFANCISPNKDKPTNSEFIASCAIEIERRMKEVRG